MYLPLSWTASLFLLGIVLQSVADPLRRGWLRRTLTVLGGSLILTAAVSYGYTKALNELGVGVEVSVAQEPARA